MNNIKRLKQYISQVEILIADTEKRIAIGDEWLDAQLISLEHRLSDFHVQLAKATKSKKNKTTSGISQQMQFSFFNF